MFNFFVQNVKRNTIRYEDKYHTHHPKVPKLCRLTNITSEAKSVKFARLITCIKDLF